MMRLFRRHLRNILAAAQSIAHGYFCEALESRTLLSADGGWIETAPEGETSSWRYAQVDDGNPLPFSIDWGDGASDGTSYQNTEHWGEQYLESTNTHIYADSGSYDASVQTDDGTGQISTGGAGTAIVANTAPYATVSSSFDDATNTLSTSLVDAWDMSSVDTDAGFHYSVATNYDALAHSYADASDTPSVQITSEQAGDYGAWIRIFDKDDGYRDYNPVLRVPDMAVATLSSSTNRLTWSDTVTGETGWRIQRSDDGQNFEIYDNIPANSTWYDDSGLAANTRYWYRVRGVGDDPTTETGYSPKKAQTTLPINAPGTPTANVISASEIDLTWSDNSTEETGFAIDWSANGSDFAPLTSVAAGTTSYNATGLTGGTQYSFRVTAVADNGVSDPSGSVQATTKPLTPSGLRAIATSNTAATISWNDVAGESGFELQRSVNGGSFATVASPAQHTVTTTDSGLSAASQYRYRIRAIENADSSEWSPEVLLEAGIINAPTNLTVQSAGSGRVRVQWDDNSNNESAFVVEYSVSGSFADSAYAFPAGYTSVLGANQTSTLFPPNAPTWGFDDVPGDSFYFRVRAFGSHGYSGYSNTVFYTSTNPTVSEDQTEQIGPWQIVGVPSAAENVGIYNGFGSGGWTTGSPNDVVGWDIADKGIIADRTDLVFPPKVLANQPGPDLVLFATRNINPYQHSTGIPPRLTEVSNSFNGYDVTTASWVDTGVARQYGSSPGSLEIYALPLDLSDMQVPEGRWVERIHVELNWHDFDNQGWGTLLGAGSLHQADAPGELLVPHRTGGKFGDIVSPDVIGSADPAQYVVLTNNDYEEHDDFSAKDFDDATALITGDQANKDSGGDVIDDDLAQFTIKKVPNSFPNGSVQIELSDSSAVRLFDDNGAELTQRSLSLSNPSGYLASLTSGDVDVWLEGLHKNPDFVFSIIYKDQYGREVKREAVHMLLAEWSFIDKNDQPILLGSGEPERTLLDDLTATPGAPIIGDDVLFKSRIDGLPTRNVDSLKMTSDSIPGDSYIDDVGSSDSVAQSSDWTALYTPGSGENDLTNAEVAALRSRFQLHALHNPAGNAELKTNGGDIQDRQLALTTLKVWDKGNADNEVTVENGSPGTLYVKENVTQAAVISFNAFGLDPTPEAGSHILWSVSGNTDQPATGRNFGGSEPSVLLNALQGDRKFVVTIGLDKNSNGALDVGEIQRTIVVYVVDDVRLNIQIQAFIKQEWVDAPAGPHSGNIFHGDNRILPGGLIDFHRDQPSYRTQQQITLEPYQSWSNSGMVPHSAIAEAGHSIEYDKASSLDSAGHITQNAKDDDRYGDGSLAVAHGFADMSQTTSEVTRLGPAKIHVSFELAANNPLVAGSPPITYHLFLSLDYTDPERPTYQLTGTHGAFPCYQIFINSHAAHTYDSGNRTPWSLYVNAAPLNRSEPISRAW